MAVSRLAAGPPSPQKLAVPLPAAVPASVRWKARRAARTT